MKLPSAAFAGSFRRRPSLVLRLVLIAVLSTAAIWYSLDFYQHRRIAELVESQFAHELESRARSDRLRFDEQLRHHRTLAKILTEREALRRYVVNDHASLTGLSVDGRPVLQPGLPSWLPERDVLRPFPQADMLVLLDRAGQIHEIYQGQETAPPTLMASSQRLARMSTDQSLLIMLDGVPYILSTAPIPDALGRDMARLMVVSKLDSGFLVRSQGPFLAASHIVALFDSASPQRVIASSNTIALPPGTSLGDVSRDYLVTGKAYFDYGNAEIKTTFVTLIPRSEAQEWMTGVLEVERHQRTILTVVIGGTLIALLLHLSYRVRRLSGRVAAFAHQVFNVEPEETTADDELDGLENRVERLTAEVLASREALDNEARDRLRLAVDQVTIQAENDRLRTLHAVTNSLGVGVIRLSEDGPLAGNDVMVRFAAQCGGLDVFLSASPAADDEPADHSGEHPGDCTITCGAQIRQFAISRPTDCGVGLVLVKDVTERRRAEEEIASFALFPAQNPHPVLRVAADGTVLHANAASEPLLARLGARRGERLIDPWPALVGDVLTSAHDHEREMVVGMRVYSLSLVPMVLNRYVNIYGSDVTARYAAEQALHALNGELEHLVTERTQALKQEIANHLRTEEALREMMEEARYANRAKSEFLANMSHELRTPLNAIIGFSEVMATQVLGPIGHPTYRGYAGDILASGHHLLDVINDILDVSKIEAGKMELAAEDVAVVDFVCPALRLVEGRAASAGLRLWADLPPTLPSLTGDGRRLKQVCVNLLANAIKFTPAGGGISVVARRDGDWLLIEFADTGIGMTEAEIGEALLPFRQVDGSLARRYEGTGLGLPLAKSFVMLHGGEFVIESCKTAGTTVSLRLPLAGPGP